jgi:phosphoribosyl 1,2-cyclic phosphate phosphodiesterase
MALGMGEVCHIFHIFVAMKLTFLGTGTSQGVPVIGCKCEVCCSEDGRDRRLRTAAMVEMGGKRFIIDAGPDFRYQMLREGVTHIDAILLTHEHKDHTGGIDDVRAFNFVDFPVIHTMHIYGNEPTITSIRRDFHYAFSEDKYRGVPEIELHTIAEDKPFVVADVEVMPVVGSHSERFRSVGFRFGELAYLTDMNAIADEEIAKLQSVKVLIVNALRWESHNSHFSVAEALEVIRRVAPERAYLTHMSHRIGLHAVAEQHLPEGVYLAYDGLTVTINEQEKE